ncbi:TolB family protein [Micromonospora sp. DT68]|uniref:TolB family protein n=1 Tax=Micromonospora TaxID=1873 RepID=UPI0033B1B0D0
MPERGWRRAAAVSAVLVVLAAIGVVVWGVATQREAPTPAAGAEFEPVLSTLPAQVRPPAQAVDLPTDRGVGRGALIYHQQTDPEDLDPTGATFERHDVYVVTVSGEQFRVGRTPEGVGPLNLSLSPDGRWLADRRDGRWRVRDLTGTAEHEVTSEYELDVWSTDARSALFMKPDMDGRGYAVMALPDGEVRQLDMRTSAISAEAGFINGREIATYELVPTDHASEMTVKLTDIATLVTRRLTVGRQETTETAPPMLALWYAGGSPPTIWVHAPSKSGQGTLLGVDVKTGAATAGIEVRTVPGQSAELCRGVVPEGVVLQRMTKTTTELVVVDPHNGARRVVTTFPRLVNLLVPGARI